MTGP
jgi:hypothetical protein